VRDTETFAIGSWQIQYFPKNEYIAGALISELEKFLNTEWLPAVRQFPSDDLRMTWAGLKNFGVPSPIIRVEMSPVPGDSLKNRIYSIGKRPALLGTLALLARQFPVRRRLISAGLSRYPFNGFIQIGDFVQDDRFVAEKILKLPYYTEIPEDTAGKYYWVRVDPRKQYPKRLFRKLEAISLVPIRSDGCNAELIALGMAKRLSVVLSRNFPWRDIDKYATLQEIFDGVLPWDKSFVMKPVQGTWGDNVEIYHQDETEVEKNAVKERMKNLVQTLGPEKLMIQPYIPDRVVERDTVPYHEIWRLYFVYLEGKYAYIGGMTQGGRSRKVCGIDDTYFISLLVC
jgi:hypothetical protein